MNRKSRIASILNASSLDISFKNVASFHLSELNLTTELEFQLPTNKRLGHLAECVVSKLIKASTNYTLLYEYIQVIKGKNTLGELDFIIENIVTKQVIHLELAYKFYLFDPNISSEKINNWIGPNRNDSLVQKLDKLKRKQFPLLYHPSTKLTLTKINTSNVSQALCLLASLYIPYEFKEDFNPIYQNAIKGYYLNFETFTTLDTAEKTYFFPSKKEWGMDPAVNETWLDFSSVKNYIDTCLEENQAPLCWQKYNNEYITFFIVWW